MANIMPVVPCQSDPTYVLVMTYTLFGNHALCKFSDIHVISYVLLCYRKRCLWLRLQYLNQVFTGSLEERFTYAVGCMLY